MKNFIFALISLSFFMGCSSVTKQSKNQTILDAAQEAEMEGTGMSSSDLRSMAERMAREITGLDFPKNQDRIRIALTELDNQTRFPLNPNLIKDRLLGDLVEMSMGKRVQYTENPNGADYFLSARITALSKGSSAGVNDYLLYSFRLTDKADTVVWMKSYETKKQGSVGVMYR